MTGLWVGRRCGRLPRSAALLPAVLVAVLAGLLAGCSPAPIRTVIPSSSPETDTGFLPAPPTPEVTCDDPTRSYTPLAVQPTPQEAAAADPFIAALLARGYLRVGVSGDTERLGARNPMTNQVEGFDIDMARAVALALFGDPSRVRLRVISAADRIAVLQAGEVDLVARAMTITCERWTRIAFSQVYYQAGQKVLVRHTPGADRPDTALPDLVGQRVCAVEGTSSLERLRQVGGVIAVAGTSHTDCLVRFQRAQVDAITGDDCVLAGLAAQDPYAVVSSAPAISKEPYGLGINANNVYFVRYVNGVLDQVKQDGRWVDSYSRWLAPALGDLRRPPAGEFGR